MPNVGDHDGDVSMSQRYNQTKDFNKSISRIDYNILNLPQRATFSGASNLFNKHIYSSSDKNLSVIHKLFIEKRIDYVGYLIYERHT